MNPSPALLLTASLFAAPALAAPDAVRVIDLRTGKDVDLEVAAKALAARDVVFLGEEHDNAAGHRLQADMLAALHARRPQLVLSMEMFERDVQGHLDDYLRGRIDEETFKQSSRPWSSYDRFYRPLVELARRHRLDVIAANVPRPIASKVAKGEPTTIDERAFVPRTTTAPDDAYRERFVEAMTGHGGGVNDSTIEKYYRSQCLKDDAMAEAIVDHLAVRGHRRPLVVHVCGSFHSDHGLGTVQRVLLRRPLLSVGVVSMEAVEDVASFEASPDPDRAHFLFVVPKPEPKPAPAPAADSDSDTKKATQPQSSGKSTSTSKKKSSTSTKKSSTS